MGRRKKSGKRTATGRLSRARDYGNEFVQQRRALFDGLCIRGGKAADQVFDGIGQLWALDYLDGHHLDPDLLRDTARQYAAIYWRRNADKAPKIGQPERVGYSRPSLDDNGLDWKFETWLDAIPAYERRVLERVVVDHWFNDGNEPFVERLVGHELMQRGRMKFARPVEPNDRETLAALLRALFVLVDGVIPNRRAA
jgi:hypothetical protein